MTKNNNKIRKIFKEKIMLENKLLVVGFMLMMKPNITSERGQKNNDLTRARKQQLKEKNFRHWKLLFCFSTNNQKNNNKNNIMENRKLFKFVKH